MTKKEINIVRKQLTLGQSEFGQLFGVHPMTVSKWERGVLSPNAYQEALMNDFKIAASNQNVKKKLKSILIGAGIVAALYFLLKSSRG